MTQASVTTHSTQNGGWFSSRLSNGWFLVRVICLCALRILTNLAAGLSRPGVHRLGKESTEAWPYVAGESGTRLWTTGAGGDFPLVAGKVQNLRVAAAQLNGVHIPAGSTRSFWKTVGRPSRWRGFVKGRELREGCLIASIGGGLCQLSNALYAAAVDAGLEIVERHAHTQVVPGSMAENGRDATVFWNYVDLRFRHTEDFTIVATLSDAQLLVQIRFMRPADTPSPRPSTSYNPWIPIHPAEQTQVNDCVACEQTACVDHIEPSASQGRTAYLLDAVWPEFDQWIGASVQPGDLALVPLDGALRNKANYRWRFLRTHGVRCVEHVALTTCRSLVSRFLPAQGAARQRRLLTMDAAFARAYARALPSDATHVVVSLPWLADLWRSGALGGRTYDVLMTRAPLCMLHEGLDRAAQLHPVSPTLRDFRADADAVRSEGLALAGARRLVTPHHAVASFVAERYGACVEALAWEIPPSTQTPPTAQSKILFPASALGRKGAYEVRAACQILDLGILCLGRAEDASGFWQGLPVEPVHTGNLFDGALCVVLPAFVEHRPGILLQALARNIPVICSAECGIPAGTPNLHFVGAGKVSDLIAAIRGIQGGGQILPST